MTEDRISEARRVPLITVAERYTTLRRIGHELHGPCPLCQAGDDRFWISADGTRWFCRKCRPSGGDVLDLVQGVAQCDLPAALDMLAGPATQLPKRDRLQAATPAKGRGSWQTDQWQLGALGKVQRCEAALPSSEGLAYLEGRGITEATQKAFRLGWAEKWAGPRGPYEARAVVLPWILPQGTVCAVKGRRIAPDVPKAKRFLAAAGGEQILFGGHLIEGREVLLAIEGEFNAMSVWQAAGSIVDVVSFGGEGMFLARLPLVATAYRQVVVWMDERERAEKVVRAVRNAEGFTSQADANQILQEHGQEALAALVRALVKPRAKLAAFA